ncbi:hypothetical protein SUGI_0697180 [Cryptomeria japonica]|nr:hypothetical protein SUGI_0697180 [Cryptomeria japonica]
MEGNDDGEDGKGDNKHEGVIWRKTKKLVLKGKKIQFFQHKGLRAPQREYDGDQDDNDPVSSIKKLLELEEDEAAVAVFICGDRSTGKSKAGDKVYSMLENELKNKKWKQLKIEISGMDSAKEGSISNTDIVPGLRSQILQNLGLKYISPDIENDGDWKKQLHKAFNVLDEKHAIENVFMYIENIPSAEILGKLLPKRNYGLNRIRLLVTTREKDVISATEGTNFKRHLYAMKGLGYKQALEFFKKKLSLSNINKPLVWNIIKICKGYKLQMKIVRDHLVKYYKDEEAFSRLLEWIETEKPSFEVLSEYLGCEGKFLRQSITTQDALLDICSFFNNREWDHVACIFEIDVLEKLKELELVKRESTKVVVPATVMPYCLSLAKGVRTTTAAELHALLAKNKLHAIKGIWLLENKFPFPISAQQLDDMPNLRVLGLGDCTIVDGECKRNFKHLRYFQAGRIQQLPFDIAHMEHLTYLDNNSNNYMGETTKNVPTTLRMVKSTALNLEHYSDLNNLPKECKLIELNLEGNDMENLSLSSAELHAVEKIVIRKCSKLLNLPKSFGNLKCLKRLDLSHCEELTELPSNFGWISNLEKVNLSFCRRLKHLPDSMNLLTCVNEIDLSYCRSIEKLPKRFSELSTLRVLNLRSCTHLLELPEEYQGLALEKLNVESCKRLKDLPKNVGQNPLMQKTVSLSWCSTIAEIPEGFIRHIKTHVEELILMDCIGLISLPDNIFMELSVLKSLNLSGCRSLLGLPKQMHKLQHLEKLNLSSCDKLDEASIRLSRLPALKELIILNCKVLKGNWLRSLSNIQSLTFVDIYDSPNLQNTWNQMKIENKVFHFTASTGGPRIVPFSLPPSTSHKLRIDKEIERGTLDFFNNKWHFMDVSGGVFYPSDLEVGSTVVIIFDKNYQEEDRQALIRILADLQATSNSMQVIYIGKFCSSLATELVGKYRFCSGDNYEAEVFFEKLLGMDQSFDHVMISSEVKGNGELKSFSDLTSITKDSLKAMTRDVPETQYLHLKELSEGNTKDNEKSNTKLLQALLLTKEINFLITSTAQVEIKDLEGKFVFLLLSWPHNIEVESKAFNEVYDKLKKMLEDKEIENCIDLKGEPMTFSEVYDKHKKKEDKPIKSRIDFEVVWIPIIIHGRGTRASHLDGIKKLKWPSIADPWSINPLAMLYFRRHPCFYKLPLLIGVPPKGKLHSENLIPNTDDKEREICKKWVTKAVQGREMMMAKMEREITNMRVTETTNVLFKFMEEWDKKNSREEKEKSKST